MDQEQEWLSRVEADEEEDSAVQAYQFFMRDTV
jgi:hypothetical protein